MGFPGGSDSKESASNVGDLDSIPGLGRSPGEGNGYPLQYSCLENSMDRGAWRATVPGIAKGWTRVVWYACKWTTNSIWRLSTTFDAQGRGIKQENINTLVAKDTEFFADVKNSFIFIYVGMLMSLTTLIESINHIYMNLHWLFPQFVFIFSNFLKKNFANQWSYYFLQLLFFFFTASLFLDITTS